MNDDENNSQNRTPLEETFDLPSLKEVNEQVTNNMKDNLEDDQDNDEEVSTENENYDDDYFNGFDDMTPEEAQNLKDRLNKTKSDLEQIRQYEYQNEKVKEYEKGVKDVHKRALDNFDEIMQTALTMEASQGSKFLTAATKLLDIALDAKNSSFDRHMKMAKMQFEREKEEKKRDPREVYTSEAEEEEKDSDEVVGQFDRNQILYGEDYYDDTPSENNSE
ncbi:hypothetical protein PBI_SCTP2_298 [Salicola phage SCTP-2]|nr:hypothetical protein PBI_SCTP2_298 [Salicola phage SCTP-2]